MQFLIALIVIVFGVLTALNGELATFQAPPSKSVAPVSAPVAIAMPSPLTPVAIGPGFLSATDRYRLARSVGFSPAEAVVATAIALAENGPGNPNAVGLNRPPALPDYGIWQINGIHAGLAGGVQNLFDPTINARVAYAVYRSGGWTQWCTYPGGCGGLPGVPNFASLLAQAAQIAEVAQ